MRLRSVLLAAPLALGVAAVPSSALAPTATRANPCTVAFDAPKGDAATYYAPVNDPDVDVTRVTWEVGVSDVVVTARVATLGAGPAAAWGDLFRATVEDHATHTRVQFGYFRSAAGGGPVFEGGKVSTATSPVGYSWTAYPGGPTHVVADFDVAHSQVALRVPRADLERAFGKPAGTLMFTLFQVDTYLVDPAYNITMADYGQAGVNPGATYLDVGACDRWLAKRGVKAPPASPCVLDVVAETGDETSRTSDAVPTRDDGMDLARVTYRITRNDLVVTLRVARLTDRPLFGTGQGYVAVFANHSTVVQFGVTRDAVDGTRVRQYGGKSVAPLTAKAVFDAPRGLVTLTVPRAALATAYGLKDTKSLVLANPGANAFWTLDGESVSAADGASAAGRTLSFGACDKTLR